MVKKISLALLIAISLTACGSTKSSGNINNSDTTAEAIEPLDLTGNYEQKNHKETFQAAYIKDDRIEVFWIMDNGDSKLLYWSGTYTSPVNGDEPYSWDSQNDKTRTNTALMASGDEIKTFTYENGELSYKVTIQGQTKEVTLVPSENDYTYLGQGTGSAAEATNLEKAFLSDSGYQFVKTEYSNYVYYGLALTNPNKEYAIEYPRYSVVVKDKNGVILGTEDMTINSIAANETTYDGGFVSLEDTMEPASVEFTVTNDDDDYVAQAGANIAHRDDLPISNLNMIGTDSRKFTGEITNNTTFNMDMVKLIAIYKKDGKIAGANFTFTHGEVQSGEKTAFELDVPSDLDFDEYEVMGLQW